MRLAVGPSTTMFLQYHNVGSLSLIHLFRIGRCQQFNSCGPFNYNLSRVWFYKLLSANRGHCSCSSGIFQEPACTSRLDSFVHDMSCGVDYWHPRSICRVMLKIQYDIDTKNESIPKAAYKCISASDQMTEGEIMVVWKRIWNAESIKQGAYAQFISSNTSFCSACFTDVPRYMRRRVTTMACNNRVNMNDVQSGKRDVSVRKVD